MDTEAINITQHERGKLLCVYILYKMMEMRDGHGIQGIYLYTSVYTPNFLLINIKSLILHILGPVLAYTGMNSHFYI